MTNLEQLLQKYCPNGVEYKTIESATTLVRGNGLPKSDFTETGVGCIHYGQIYTYYGTSTITTKSFVSQETASKLKRVDPGDVVITNTSENIEDVCKAVAWLGTESIVTGGHATIIKHNENPKYIVYCTQSERFFAQKNKLAMGIKVIDVSATNLAKIKIPLPPRPVQDEIVRLLDELSQHTEQLGFKLNDELVSRKIQYELYRDKLLTFGIQARSRRFGDIASICRGASPRPINNFITNSNDGTPWIKIGDASIDSKYITSTKERITKEGMRKSRFVKKGSFILSNSMSFGRPYILQISGCIHDGWLSISDFEENIIPDFLYHLLSSSVIQKEMKKRASFGGAVQNLNSDIVKNLVLPLPSIPEQRQIVKALNGFDNLRDSAINALSNEITARQQQYEYYRDKLLAFPEKEA